MQEHLLQSREQSTFTKATGPRQDEANYEQQAREHKRPISIDSARYRSSAKDFMPSGSLLSNICLAPW